MIPFFFLVNCKWRVYKSLLRLMLSGLWVPHCERQRVSHTSGLTAAPLASCACGSPGPCPPADWKGMVVRGAEPQQRSTQTPEIMPHWFSISESRDRFQTSLSPRWGWGLRSCSCTWGLTCRHDASRVSGAQVTTPWTLSRSVLWVLLLNPLLSVLPLLFLASNHGLLLSLCFLFSPGGWDGGASNSEGGGEKGRESHT